MKGTVVRKPFSAISGLLLCLALALGPVGCQDAIWVLPENGSVKQGPFDVEVYWSSEMVASTLQVSMNQVEITPNLSPASSVSITPDVEIAGVMGMWIHPFPGRQVLTAQMLDTYGLPHGVTSIFTSTSTAPRQDFEGGLMVFECLNSFVNSPIQIPGIDLDLGFSEGICMMMPISGLFPSGDSAFPVVSDPLPVLYGLFPKSVTYDVDASIPNGISVSPVEVGLSLDFDPADPTQEGNVCEASFVMAGTILPVDPAISGLFHAGMVQTLREVSLSLVSEGECVNLFTSPADVDVMTFNYAARK